ncbi:hypothetical protein [Aquabacterium sp.]|uniref:hypothetical protein n=1 Tax=Aquabacterium sp. TaxID=1872578 RepID=UPI004037F4B7
MATSPAWASPGAHGPNGEHLDGPSTSAQGSGAVPRMEAKSEDFELVARLAGGEFTMMINRFATGEPVLSAQIEVESGAHKVRVPFHKDLGDYATDDEALLKLLATPGAHPVVITIVAGSDSDLLEGTLNVTTEAAKAFVPGGHDHGHAHGDDDHDHGEHHWARKPITWILGFAGLAALGWGVARWRSKDALTAKQQGDA